MEPRDLWEKRIDQKWRDRAPQIAALDESGDFIVIDGMRPRPLAFEGPMADLKAQGIDIPVRRKAIATNRIAPARGNPTRVWRIRISTAFRAK